MKIRRLVQNRIENTYESERKIVCQKTMTDGFQADKKVEILFISLG